jgi:uncharacterized repeat protein (TIGR04138 family)
LNRAIVVRAIVVRAIANVATEDVVTPAVGIVVLEIVDRGIVAPETEVLEIVDRGTVDLETVDLETVDLETVDLETEDLETVDLETEDLETEDLETEDLGIVDRGTVDEPIVVAVKGAVMGLRLPKASLRATCRRAKPSMTVAAFGPTGVETRDAANAQPIPIAANAVTFPSVTRAVAHQQLAHQQTAHQQSGIINRANPGTRARCPPPVRHRATSSMSAIQVYRRLADQDPRYAIAAYSFVTEALRYARTELKVGATEASDEGETGRKSEPRSEVHLSGPQVCDVVRKYAQRQFGMLARAVLESWGIRSTGDIGEVVFKLIRVGQLKKSKRDKREDFDDVFEFDEAFRYELPIPKGVAP